MRKRGCAVLVDPDWDAFSATVTVIDAVALTITNGIAVTNAWGTDAHPYGNPDDRADRVTDPDRRAAESHELHLADLRLHAGGARRLAHHRGHSRMDRQRRVKPRRARG